MTLTDLVMAAMLGLLGIYPILFAGFCLGGWTW